jgi:hypothetical protein
MGEDSMKRRRKNAKHRTQNTEFRTQKQAEPWGEGKANFTEQTQNPCVAEAGAGFAFLEMGGYIHR